MYELENNCHYHVTFRGDYPPKTILVETFLMDSRAHILYLITPDGEWYNYDNIIKFKKVER